LPVSRAEGFGGMSVHQSPNLAMALEYPMSNPAVATALTPKIIDFHNHHVPARFELAAAKAAPGNQRARWDAIARRVSDESILLHDVCEGEISARVVKVPAALIADADGSVAHETIMATNDHLAELVVRPPGRIHGLASVDAYDGDRSAREAERAIRELGLRSLFVDCARGDALVDAPQTRPTLEVAAKLGVRVRPCNPRAIGRLALTSLLACSLELLDTTHLLAELACKPMLSFRNVREIRSAQAPIAPWTWRATLVSDASYCATRNGSFEIDFVRMKEYSPDLQFTEKLQWTRGQFDVSIELDASEFIIEYRVGFIAPCVCREFPW
jgi:hypothetical protein